MKLFIKRISGAILASLLVISLSVSCQRERFGENAPSDPDVVRLSFSVLPNTDGPFTRSSISSDTDKLDTTVNDMNIWIYRDGLLYRQIYRTTTADTTMRLDSSTAHAYHIFALANVGKRTPQIKLTDLRDFDKFYLDSITVDYMTEHGLPMAYEADLTFGTATHQVLLKRYVARYDFRIDRSHMKGSFTVKSVALCQSRNIFNPFYTGQQFATKTDQVEKGDSSSTADVTALNNGNPVVFYALQNKHGVLGPLESNTDPWKKIPENMSGYGDKCTYIHLKGTYKDSVLSREMDYRFYLGKDAVKDFTVEENTSYTVTFFPSDSSTTKLGNWKVEGYKPGETDPREIKIADGAFKSGDTLKVAVSTDTALAFSANCSVDTLVHFSADGFRYEFKKAAANSDAVDSLKIFVDTTATVDTVDFLVFSTFDKKKTFTINVKAIQGGPAPIPPLLPVEFTVNTAGKRVQFTRGNLYYDSSKSKWHLEDQQYYTPANGTWSTDHIAHFWWSKIASVAYNSTYSDSSCATNDTLFCGEGYEINVDGVDSLYALSAEEWMYLAYYRNGANKLHKAGVTVCGVLNCVIIAPDNFSGTIETEYDDAAWLTAQAAGLVCLPPSGVRRGTIIDSVGFGGGFWTTSAHVSDPSKAYGFLYKGDVIGYGYKSRDYGASTVRLVKTVGIPIMPEYSPAPGIPSVLIDSIWWAPVNCGYDATHPYGLLYQWGRKYGQGYDGETPACTLSPSRPATVAEGSNDTNKNTFFTGNTCWTTAACSASDDWFTTYNPCPSGWRVPTESELEKIVSAVSSMETQGGISGRLIVGKLFLPFAGKRDMDGNPSERATIGRYWSSSSSGDPTWMQFLYCNSTNIYIGGDAQCAWGCSVRCVQDAK